MKSAIQSIEKMFKPFWGQRLEVGCKPLWCILLVKASQGLTQIQEAGNEEEKKQRDHIVKGMDSLKDEIFGPILLLINHLEQMFLHNAVPLPSNIFTQE